ncbi:MAG TPA: IPT/TIG domain-containing protein, partial [Reyranella sp.]
MATTAIPAAQPASIYYVYDDLNRLSAVVNQQGDVAVYTYDAVGNILRIERFNATELPGAARISYFAPSVGREGTVVQIFGKGFSATPGQNSLAFNGTPAVITSAAPNRLVASVPTGATTGPLSVSAPLGSATSAASFRVLGGALAVAPAVTEVQ